MELVFYKMEKEKIEGSKILFSKEYFVNGASAGCYRIFFKYLLSLEETKVDLFIECIKYIGFYTLPRYAEIRELFTHILKYEEYRQALISALDSYDGKLREAASMILASCDKNVNGNALIMVILGMVDSSEYREWCRFIASQKYGDEVLNYLLSQLDLLLGEQRILALAILAYNGAKITKCNKEELISAKTNWKYSYTSEINLSDFELSDENVFGKLCDQGKADCIEYDVARTLLWKYYDKLCLEERVKCILSVWANGPIPSIEEIIFYVSQPEFGELFFKYRENYQESSNYKILKCFTLEDELNINWNGLVWEVFCNDTNWKGVEIEETGLRWLLMGRRQPEYGRILGDEIRKVIDDDRLQGWRWVEKYHWMLILIDEFTDCDKKFLAEHTYMDREGMSAASISLIWRLGEELLIEKLKNSSKEVKNRKEIGDNNFKLLEATKESELFKKDILDIVFAKVENDQVLDDGLLADIEKQGKNGILVGAVLRYIYEKNITVEIGFECNKLFCAYARGTSKEYRKIISCVRMEFFYKCKRDLGFNRQYNELVAETMQSSIDNQQKNFIMYEFTRIKKENMTIEELENVLVHLFGCDSANLYGIYTMKNVLPFIKDLCGHTEKEKVLETVYRCLLKNEYSADNRKIVNRNSYCDMALPIAYWCLKGNVTDFGMKLFANGMIKFFFKEESWGINEKERSFIEKYEDFLELMVLIEDGIKEKVLLKLCNYPLPEVRILGKLLKGI